MTALLLAIGAGAGLGVVLALTAVLGATFAIAQPAELALVPPLAGDRVQEANGHVETIRYLGYGVGPLLGGALYAAGGIELAMLVNGLSFMRAHPSSTASERHTPGSASAAPSKATATSAAMATEAAATRLDKHQRAAGHPERPDGHERAVGLRPAAEVVGDEERLGHPDRRHEQQRHERDGDGDGECALAKQDRDASRALGRSSPATEVGARAAPARPRPRPRARVRAYNGIRNAAELGAFAAGGILVTAIGARGTLLYAGALSALAGVAGVIALRRARSAAPAGEPLRTAPQRAPA